MAWQCLSGGKRRLLIVILILMSFIVVLALGLGIGLNTDKSALFVEDEISRNQFNKPVVYDVPASFNEFEASGNQGPGGRDWHSVGRSDSKLGSYSRAAISSDGVPCATVAKDILSKKGTAADAAIAGLFCVGVVNSQSMGLGGGFLATYYDKATNTAHTLDAREVAPRASTPDMFKGNASASRKGGLSVAVPGELKGYHALYLKFGGGVSWRELLAPAIRICEEGHGVNWHMARALKLNSDQIEKEPSMSVFVSPATGKVYQEGDIIKRPVLASTLRAIQDNPDTLYTGPLKDKLLQDLNNFGAIIQQQDFAQYKAKWRTPVQVPLSNGDFTLFTVPPPSSGVLLGLILNILDDFNLTAASITGGNGPLTYQLIAESLKFAYARRTQLGDEDFEDMTHLLDELASDEAAATMRSKISVNSTSQDPTYYGAVVSPPPNDHGTAHFSLLAENGDAVTVTSTINLYFGAGIRSEQTGIVLNDQMDDFSTPDIINYFGLPPFSANYIKPGKRPLSSMSPSIIVDSAGNVRLVLGAAGGSKIPSGLAMVAIGNLWFGKNIKQAIDARRIHHQLFPMVLMYEHGFNKTLVDHLVSVGHKVQEFDVGGSVVCAVSEEAGRIFVNSDFRKSGQVDGI